MLIGIIIWGVYLIFSGDIIMGVLIVVMMLFGWVLVLLVNVVNMLICLC